MTNDTRFLELLASKICHDLISPVGAVSNGVEILQEMGADAGDEVTDLIAYSAEQAASKLKAMRLAYGLGGADTSILPKHVHEAFGGYLGQDNRIKQDWSAMGLNTSVSGAPKMLMCGLMLVSEALPKGGIISAEQEDEQTILITAKGENAHFRSGVIQALTLESPVTALEPIHVHAYITGLQAKNYDITLSTDLGTQDVICLRLKLPAVF